MWIIRSPLSVFVVCALIIVLFFSTLILSNPDHKTHKQTTLTKFKSEYGVIFGAPVATGLNLASTYNDYHLFSVVKVNIENR